METRITHYKRFSRFIIGAELRIEKGAECRWPDRLSLSIFLSLERQSHGQSFIPLILFHHTFNGVFQLYK